MSRPYLLGALHDGTVRRKTIRICQREEAYVKFLRDLILGMGARAWTYREGKTRELYVVEFTRGLLEDRRIGPRWEKIDYARGYFDAEGGIPANPLASPYLYFAQKDREDISELRSILLGLGIQCGDLHNPSRRQDPEYWRFYVRRASIASFARIVGSWHPRKEIILKSMVDSISRSPARPR